MNQKTQKRSARQKKSFTVVDAKTALLRKKLTIEALSKKLRPERSRSTVSKAINKVGRFPHVRAEVARVLGL